MCSGRRVDGVRWTVCSEQCENGVRTGENGVRWTAYGRRAVDGVWTVEHPLQL